MILSYDSLIKLRDIGYGVIDAPITAYQAASIDVTLSDSFKKPVRKDGSAFIIIGDGNIEYQDLDYTTKNDTPGVKYFRINAHEFVLASTKETIKLNEWIAAHIEGRSSIGRSGLFIQNASWINPGFEGQITLEIFNANDFPIYIYSGMRIGQIIIEALDTNTNKPYSGKYLGQKDATPPINEDYKDNNINFWNNHRPIDD